MLPIPLPFALGLAASSAPAAPFCLTPWDGDCTAPPQPPFPRFPPNAYKPGQSVRFVVFVTSQGSPAAPASLTLTMRFPDGTTATGVIVLDVLGQYHADVLIPSAMAMGRGAYRWQVGPDGVNVDNNAVAERHFDVVPLDF